MVSNYAPQGSPEWYAARLGKVTSSRFADVMTQPQSKAAKESGQLSKTAERYMRDLLGEHLTGKPSEEITSKYLEWGKEWEGFARNAYCEHVGIEVEQVGFVEHPIERLIGCSPDGFAGDDVALEIKCPFTAAQHLLAIESGSMPDDHEAQVQGGLWITGRQYWDFVSYHPHFPRELQLFVVRVERDEEYIATLATAVVMFRDMLLERIQNIFDKVRQTSEAA